MCVFCRGNVKNIQKLKNLCIWFIKYNCFFFGGGIWIKLNLVQQNIPTNDEDMECMYGPFEQMLAQQPITSY